MGQSVLDHRAAHISHAHSSLLLIYLKTYKFAMNHIYFSAVFLGL